MLTYIRAMDKNEIDRRVADFAVSLQGALGPLPLERIVKDHLGLFAEMRRNGASWRQIAAMMAKNGIKKKDGGIIDSTQWAAMVSRAGRKGDKAGRQPQKPLAVAVPAYQPSPLSVGDSNPSTDYTTLPAPSPKRSGQELDRALIRERMKGSLDARSDG